MGSSIELNDTLKISKERGFPAELTLVEHLKSPFKDHTFDDEVFAFYNPGERLYNRPPTRVFLVEEIDGKWLYWGHALVLNQMIDSTTGQTRGQFRITKIYEPAYQKQITLNESPTGKSYF